MARSGKAFEEIMDAYPELSKEDLSATVRYARKLIEEEKSASIS